MRHHINILWYHRTIYDNQQEKKQKRYQYDALDIKKAIETSTINLGNIDSQQLRTDIE